MSYVITSRATARLKELGINATVVGGDTDSMFISGANLSEDQMKTVKKIVGEEWGIYESESKVRNKRSNSPLTDEKILYHS